ncbi:23S rRNA (uracil(1939)-C(5))-methyltransferase RlmD [Treponema ruminis]|uniref:23S rRNA (Uracil1939-C5)-methyltransferase n=1 Tax=Treponema ruminis TaxID=744515 RepID=A0A7W8G7M2_9SPIR|nr:23S rRNA (uracil(1939)-C(5))-methyltransferase RlmD [Treponema ruminis]MBB5225224.1 23S rRNA (uracil1939-C5)-methyltransferase [Treponema ruminis]QSI01905.1 23S rRNA (uracil(1939)-C(5))-methyltransferase RlmD [Treponema ruminis]
MSHIIHTEKMVAGGDCLAHINGKNVFVPFALPDEELEVEITKSFRDYDTAKITRILKSSPHRVEPFCPLYGTCGGCNLQHIDSEYQVELRKSILRECFEREGIQCPEIEIISGSDKNYRSRIQLTNGSFNKKASNELVNLENCPIATEEINTYLKNTAQNERANGRVHLFGDQRISSDSKVIIAEERERVSREIKVQGASSKRKEKLRLQANRHFAGTTLNQNNRCEINLLGKKIAFDVQGFFQSNLEVLEKTIEAVTRNMGGRNVLDMYSGCGTFSVFLADLFDKVCMVEHNRDAIVFAEENLRGKNHESFGLSGENWIKFSSEKYIENNGEFESVVIDPPRSGMEKEVCKWLCRSKIPQIRSVSCNPSTHARDASFLVKAGYHLSKLYLLDFYPHTAHIESLACFEYTD